MQTQSVENCGTINGSKSCKQSYANTNYYSTSTAGYNKSSSYPNFNSSGSIQHGNHHHSYHRHSVSNLITITPSQTTASIVTTPSASHLHHHQHKTASTTINFIPSNTKPAISTSQLPHQQATTTLTMTIGGSTSSKLSKTNNNNNSTNNANLNSANGSLHSFGSNTVNHQALNTNVTGDLISDREFFIRQIAEQAIN